MKTLLLNCSLIVILFVSCSSPSSSEDNIIGEPIRIGRIEVAQNDFPCAMSWNKSTDEYKFLGSGWRLPTIDELKLMYLNKDKIGSFAKDYYWSSSEDVNGRRQVFYNGFQYDQIKGGYYLVWAVRSF